MFSSNASQVSNDANYIEDVFSTYLYSGNATARSISNGIDLSTKGGLTWVKNRGAAAVHVLVDSARGVNAGYINSASTGAQSGTNAFITSLNTDGFSVAGIANASINASGNTYASWTFREQPKFFDVVTYSGNSANNRAISHSLGSTPGCIIVKNITNATDWCVWHRSLSSSQELLLNTRDSAYNYGAFESATSTTFTVNDSGYTNQTGSNYVAYIFAHDAGGFGLTGTDNVISCGAFSTDAGGKATVNLGYEPQWVMFKRTDSSTFGDWYMIDNMRGFTNPSGSSYLWANTSAAEVAGINFAPESTGFSINFTGPANWVYIAIRRGPMKVPTDGTKVFSPVTDTGTAAAKSISAGLTVDAGIRINRDHATWSPNTMYDRLRGSTVYMNTNTTAADTDFTPFFTSFDQSGITLTNSGFNGSGATYINYFFKRAPSFFDEVCYTGNVTARTINHNLGAVPEMMIVKTRSSTTGWVVYHQALGNTKYLYLDLNVAQQGPLSSVWNNTTPTSSVFSVGTGTFVNGNAETFVAYLFATCAGVSKVGSYTGTGTTLQVDCGFAAGARFVLIKRTDSTGDWYVWDTARGIVSGNDPYLRLNSTAAETTSTDYIDTYSAGFELSSTAPAALNASGGTYIFLAIA